MKIGIIGAMEAEVKSLREKMEGVEVKNIGGADFYSGKLFGKDVVIVQCGIGKVNAALRTQLLISNFGITHLINTGIAGSMASGLGIFDFVVSEKTVYHDFDTTAFGYKIGQVPGLDPEFTADAEMITLYYGQDVTQQQAQAMADQIADAYPDCEVEVYEGGQPLYYYIISAE